MLIAMNIPKHHVIRAAQNKLDPMLADHRDRISDLRSATIRDELQETASQSESNHMADIELLDRFSEQAQRLERERDLLGRFEEKTLMESFRPGAMVITDKRNFLIGASIEEFAAGGVEFLGLSTEAPLYKALDGRRKGDQVKFQDVAYDILDVR